MADLDQLVPDIYSLLEGKTLADPEVLKRFGLEFGDILSQRINSEERSPTLRMSNIGRPLRQLYYEMNGYPAEEINGKTHFKFVYGSLLESLAICLAEAAGHEISNLQGEVELDGILGHIDCEIDGYVVDVKSCSPFSFAKFENETLLEEGNDPFGYLGQICGYAKVLGKKAAWLAINKVSGELCVLKVPDEKIEEYDVQNRIKICREAIKQAEPPERCYEPEPDGKSGNLKLPVPCSYCGWKFECHKDANDGEGIKVYSYSTGPRFLVKVIREPKVFPFKQESN